MPKQVFVAVQRKIRNLEKSLSFSPSDRKIAPFPENLKHQKTLQNVLPVAKLVNLGYDVPKVCAHVRFGVRPHFLTLCFNKPQMHRKHTKIKNLQSR
jgi:hypothetical protein